MAIVLIFCRRNPSRSTSDFVTDSQSVSQSVSYSVLCDLNHLWSSLH